MSDLFEKPFSTCTMEIKRDEDWRNTVVLRRRMADGSVTDLDFANIARLDLFIRPEFDHTVLIRQLSSLLSLGNEIQFSSAVPGEVKFIVPRATVIASIPTGKWRHFLVATYNDATTEEFWRGPFIVHPGKISP